MNIRRKLRKLLSIAAVLAGTVVICGGASAQTTYKYDPLGRLISTVAPAPKQGCSLYAYDPAGNRTQVTTVSGSTPAAPIAVPVFMTVFENLGATLDPRVSDPACTGLTITAVGAASGPNPGKTQLAADGSSITYTPAAGYTGPDAFTYTICDGSNKTCGDSNPPQTGNATVAVEAVVLGPTASPAAIGNVISVKPGHQVVPWASSSDISASFGDPFGFATTIQSVGSGASGTASVNGPKGVSYTYGSEVTAPATVHDQFPYTVSDGKGGTATSVVSVSISIVNSGP